MRYQSPGLQPFVQMLFRVKGLGLLQPFNVRVEATHISLAGRLNLGVQLTKEPPGIKWVTTGQ